MWCKVCGGEIYPGIESVNGTHADADYCVVILNARVEHEMQRAEAAEKRVAELEAVFDTAVHVSINGAIHRVLPAPVGFAGNSRTEWEVTLGKLVVVPFGFADSLPDGE